MSAQNILLFHISNIAPNKDEGKGCYDLCNDITGNHLWYDHFSKGFQSSSEDGQMRMFWNFHASKLAI
ncbi:hypothetical protein SU69_05575 [Thermosipho melanesiensis]|uniref:Uncharacterized protein n=1 Tax=Thermosipho melanesiensis TaxID=46541 RepID=A0ABM6GGP4_9BACT|nr:hypothetical protein [Thermosipho melanesiensis]APT74878.1 hypothetical protein BW47_05840 [Thermosipho melanesiensis]OOC35995.1 hypothetical protein SU68_05635 [Thermosipho melanesiensis]OOC38134.1 hypothetical protein SU69_05575 [Thermosipho melanesiensis]OOC38263.1 hypothetical protein SU70_05585 [Thermosipho melanesiensis]OOC41363.1 hypothetical protein SU71_05565 [Thermosipho melanesiensis]